MDFITDTPMLGIAAFTALGALLAKTVFPYLEKLVAKTPSTADDELLVAVEKVAIEAVAKKTAKAKSKVAK